MRTGWRFMLAVACALQATAAMAGESPWSWRTDAQALYGSYTGSKARNALASAGAFVSGDYLERGGFTLGGNLLRLSFRSGLRIRQREAFGNLRWRAYPRGLAGSLGMRLNAHFLRNDDPTGLTNRVLVLEPHLSFLNYAETFYLDLAYAWSRYPGGLRVQQITPAVGFALGSEWLQLRGFFIRPSDAARAQGKRSTRALEIGWTHWFAPGALVPEKLKLSALAGERIYAVDGDAALAYNLADLQRGALALMLTWRLGDKTRLEFVAGAERYRNRATNDSYQLRYLYAHAAIQW